MGTQNWIARTNALVIVASISLGVVLGRAIASKGTSTFAGAGLDTLQKVVGISPALLIGAGAGGAALALTRFSKHYRSLAARFVTLIYNRLHRTIHQIVDAHIAKADSQSPIGSYSEKNFNAFFLF